MVTKSVKHFWQMRQFDCINDSINLIYGTAVSVIGLMILKERPAGEEK